MLRRVTTEFIEDQFGLVIAAFTVLFGFITYQPSYTFSHFVASNNAAPGGTSWLFWLGAIVVFVGGGIAFFYFLITIPHLANLDPLNGIHYAIFGEDLSTVTRLLYSVGLYGITLVAYVLGGNPVPSLARADAVREYSAYIVEMYTQGGARFGAEAFSYGFLDNPELSFGIQVFLLTIVATSILRYYIPLKESTIFVATNAIVVVGYFGAYFTGTDVFPMEARWVFSIQVVLTFGMLVFLTSVMNMTGWVLMKYGFKGRRKNAPERPVKEEHAFDAFLLLIAIPVFPTALGAFLAWFSVKLSYLGAWDYVAKTNSTSNPEPQPTTGD